MMVMMMCLYSYMFRIILYHSMAQILGHVKLIVLSNVVH